MTLSTKEPIRLAALIFSSVNAMLHSKYAFDGIETQNLRDTVSDTVIFHWI